MSEKSSFRPTLEALEDRMLLSFSLGLGQPLTHQAPPPVSSVQVSGSAESGGVESMVRLRRIVGDAIATPGVQPQQITLHKVTLESLQTMDGPTTAVTAKPTFLKINLEDVIIS
jgi:hypothetical protein